MNELVKLSCEPCQHGDAMLDEKALQALKGDIPDWRLEEVDTVRQLQRQYTFPNFVDAMAFANRVADLAETHNHHPAILVEWGRVTVNWWTHAISGVHKNDAIMAAKTDALCA